MDSDCEDEDDNETSSDDLTQNEKNEKPVTIKSPIREKKKEAKTAVLKKPILRRVSSSGKISKRKNLVVRKKFGMNKGVQHAIRKPIFKNLKKKKLAEKKKEEKVNKNAEKKQKKEKEKEEEEETGLEVEAEPRVAKALPAAKSPNLYKPKKSGKLNVAQNSPNVSYEIRNGFPVFRSGNKNKNKIYLNFYFLLKIIFFTLFDKSKVKEWQIFKF
jgi:hypothetical protein